MGNPQAKEEELIAYEAGVRTTLGDRLAVDFSGYLNRYAGLLMYETGQPQLEISQLGPHLLVPLTPENSLDATTVGIETMAVLTPTPSWNLTGTFAVFRMPDWQSGALTPDTAFVDGETPRVQWSLRSSFSRRGFDYDAKVMNASSLREPFVPGYLRADARISRRLSSGLEIALAGQNLLGARHREAAGLVLVGITDVRRTIALRAT